jgi:hypothetical protein
MEDDPVHGHRDEVVGTACFSGLDGGGQVDVAQDYPPENGAVLVGVAGEKRYPKAGIADRVRLIDGRFLLFYSISQSGRPVKATTEKNRFSVSDSRPALPELPP